MVVSSCCQDGLFRRLWAVVSSDGEGLGGVSSDVVGDVKAIADCKASFIHVWRCVCK